MTGSWPRLQLRVLPYLAMLACALGLGMGPNGSARADGTETLGNPSIAIGSGTGIAAAGVGLINGSGTISLELPADASVVQVLLYWSGESPIGPDDTIVVEGTEVTGTTIGGPTLFFLDFDATAFRADVTELGLVGPGMNDVFVEGLDFLAPQFDTGLGNHGAGLLVILDDGSAVSNIQVKDGVDLAFCGFPAPRQTTIPQSFSFPADVADRSADLTMFFGSVGGEAVLRPNRIEITTGGVTTSLVNQLGGIDGELWDTLTVPVVIPAGATDVTVQAISATSPPACASMTWVAAALSVPEPPRCGDGIPDPGEECDDGNQDNFDGCRNDCTLPFCGDGIQDPGEACDDGNQDNFDGCRNDCTLPFCGDGIQDPGEACDDGNQDNFDGCRNNCTLPFCGDGIQDPGEECDDGNTTGGDGCSGDCRVEDLCDLDVTKTATPDTIVLTPPPGCDTLGKPNSLTFLYTGDPCSATTNTQNDKVECDGDPAGAEPVQAVWTGKDADKIVISPSSESIDVGDTFTVARIDASNLPSNSDLEIRQGGSLLQDLRIHTSCSQELNLGDQFGSLVLVGWNGSSGGDNTVDYEYSVTNNGDPLSNVSLVDDRLGLVGEVALLASGETRTFSASAEITETTTNTVTVSGQLPEGSLCDAQAQATVTVEPPPRSCADGKPKALVFEYTGDPCSATTNTQLGKFKCDGNPAGAEPIRVVMTDDANKIDVIPGTETIGIGGLFTIQAQGNKLASDTKFAIRQDSSTLQSLNIHTSCSKELNVGDQFGSVILRDFIPEP